jgi:hypothetical protein
MFTGRMKLHREDFRDPRFDVVRLFPNDPDMHIINTILEKSVVTGEQDCLRSARDLWLMVGALSEMVERGGQLLQDGVARPCRVCRVGYYEPGLNSSIAVGLNRFVNNVDQHIGVLRMTPFTCDRCGHMQFFKG